MKKYIYYFTISIINANIDMEKFPIVYESSKEVVFVIGKGTTKKMYKDDCNLFKNLNNEDIINMLKSRDQLFCLGYTDNFNAKEMYYTMYKDNIIMTLDGKRSKILEKYKDLCKDIDEYNNIINKVNKYCNISNSEFKNITLIEGDKD